MRVVTGHESRVLLSAWHFVCLLHCAIASSVSIHQRLDELKQERQTWQLVSGLYRERLKTESHIDIDIDEDLTSVSQSQPSYQAQNGKHSVSCP